MRGHLQTSTDSADARPAAVLTGRGMMGPEYIAGLRHSDTGGHAPDEGALCRAVGGREASRAAALVGGGGAQHRVGLLLCGGCALISAGCRSSPAMRRQHGHRDALAATVAVRGSIEGAAPSHRRQCLQPRRPALASPLALELSSAGHLPLGGTPRHLRAITTDCALPQPHDRTGVLTWSWQMALVVPQYSMRLAPAATARPLSPRLKPCRRGAQPFLTCFQQQPLPRATQRTTAGIRFNDEQVRQQDLHQSCCFKVIKRHCCAARDQARSSHGERTGAAHE